jgi:hypothetical protein
MGSALLWVWGLAKRGRLSVEAVSLVVFSIAILADKAFAAQYLVWVVPFWAYWPIRRGWVAAAALTTAVYPLFYGEAHLWGPSFYLPTAAAALRNAVFVVATVAWLREQLRARRSRGQPRGEEARASEEPVSKPNYVLAN